MALAHGIYRIIPKSAADVCVEVAGASKSNHANVQLYAANDSDAQKIWVGADNSGYTDFRFIHSAMMLDVWSGVAETGSNITQFEYNSTRAQDWQLVDAGENITHNGQAYDLYYIKSKINTKYVLDAWSGQTKNGTNVWLYEFNKTDAQKWFLVKDSSLNPKLPIPTNIGCVKSSDAPRITQVSVNATPIKVFPAWKCSSVDGWQVRWSWRGRKTGTSTWSGWTTWRSLQDAQTDEGWGDVWTPNLYSYSHSGKTDYYSPIFETLSLSVDQTTYDKKEFRIQVRQTATSNALSWNANGVPQHGHVATGTISAVWWPTLTVNALTWTPDGLMIGYSTDFKQGNNRFAVGKIKGSNGYLTNREVSFTSLAQTGTITIPFSELMRIPDKGESVTFSIALSTIDCSRTQSFTKTISYDANHGIALSITQTPSAGNTILAKLSGSYTLSECHIAYEQDGMTVLDECPLSSNGFIVTPPFGKSYTLFAKASKSDNTWGTKTVPGKVVKCRAHVFNYDSAWCQVVLFETPLSATAHTFERDYETYQTNGRTYESIFFGEGLKGTLSIDGIAPLKPDALYPNSTFDDLRLLAECKYTIYRTPWGTRHNVAVVSLDDSPYAPGYRKVSIHMKERS